MMPLGLAVMQKMGKDVFTKKKMGEDDSGDIRVQEHMRFRIERLGTDFSDVELVGSVQKATLHGAS